MYNSFSKLLNCIEDVKTDHLEWLLEDGLQLFESFEPITLACKEPEEIFYALVSAIVNQIDLPPGSNKTECISDLDKLFNLTN